MFADAPDSHGLRTVNASLPALERVANRPIAHHVLDALLAGGVRDIVVAGTADDLIDVRASVQTYPGTPATIEYAVCSERFDMVRALRAAAPFVGAVPCIVHVADGLLGEPLAPYVGAPKENSADVVLLCRRRSDGINVAPSGVRAGWTSGHADAGIGVFGPGAFRQACEAEPAPGFPGLERLACQIEREGGDVQIRTVEDWHRYSGDPADLLDLNHLVLDALPAAPQPALGSENRIEGRVCIDPTATVSSSVIVGPVVVGAGAEITDAYIGPYTSIGAGVRIAGAEIERSIIFADAIVMHVGARLVSSLVGRGARVFRDFSLPKALRLRVGDGDEVALC